MKLISNPFSIDKTDAADKYQLELIDIQNDSYLKTAFAEHDQLNFYSHYHQTSIPISQEVHCSVRKHLQLRITVF